MASANPNTARPGPTRAEWAWVAAASVLAAVFACLPYVLAYGVHDHVFTGILINPADGNSYLAKMAEVGAATGYLPCRIRLSPGQVR